LSGLVGGGLVRGVVAGAVLKGRVGGGGLRMVGRGGRSGLRRVGLVGAGEGRRLVRHVPGVCSAAGCDLGSLPGGGGGIGEGDMAWGIC